MTQHVNPQQESREGSLDSVDVDSVDRADITLPTQQRSSEHSGPIPRPFAMGSVIEEQVIPAPRRGSAPESHGSPEALTGGVLAPPRPTTAEKRARSRRTTLLMIGGVLGVVLLMAGLYTASVLREHSPDADEIAPAAALHDVTYRVTTTGGSKIVVSYSETHDGDYSAGSATDVPSPWSVDTRVSDYYGPSVTASVVPNDPDGAATDSISCSVVENGRTVSQQTQTGPNATVSCLP